MFYLGKLDDDDDDGPSSSLAPLLAPSTPPLPSSPSPNVAKGACINLFL